jgi:hypothetical protein
MLVRFLDADIDTSYTLNGYNRITAVGAMGQVCER